MRKIFCQLSIAMALLQGTVMAMLLNNEIKNPTSIETKRSHHSKHSHTYSRIFHYCSWDEIKTHLQLLREEGILLGDFPLLLVDYNETLVSFPYGTIIRQFMRNNNCIIEKYAAKAMVNSCYDKKLPSGRFYEGEVVEGALDCIKSYQNAGFSTVVITLGSFDIHSTRSEAMQNSGLNSCINLSEDKFEPSSISRKYPDGSLRFEWSLPDEKRIRAYYLGGHLYCAQFPNAQRAKSKGNTLRAFLETLKKNPTLIVAVDDKDYNILSIKEVCKKLKIPYLGFIIDLEENNANNIKKAAQEFSPEILTQIDSCIEVAQGRNHKNISIEGLPNVGLSTTTRKAEYIGMNTPAPTAAPKQTNLEKTLSAPTIANETEDDQDISISSLFSEEEFAPKVNNAGAPYGLTESSPQHNTSIAPAPFIELKQEYNREKNSQGMPKRMISPPSGYLSRIMPRANEKSPTPYMVKSSISPNSVKVKGKHRTFIIEDIEPSSSVPSMPPQTVTKGRFTIEEIGSSSSVPILPTQAVTKGRFTIKEIGSSSSAPILPTQTVTKGRFTIEDIGGSSSSAPISPPPAVTKSRFIVEDIGSSSSAPVSPPPAVTKGRFIVEDIGSSSSAPVSPPQAVTKSRFIVEDIGSSSSAPVSPPPTVTRSRFIVEDIGSRSSGLITPTTSRPSTPTRTVTKGKFIVEDIDEEEYNKIKNMQNNKK